jgi:hypothetical protein
MITHWNTLAGWSGMAAGAVLGMLIGLRAESRDWAGGYGSFRRQALRLAHVAAFALGIINVLYGLSAAPRSAVPAWAARAGAASMVAGGLLMPLVCLGAAWRRGLKFLFPIPATLVLAALVVQAWGALAAARGEG